ncbi:fimbrial protein [Babesia caballi]|uniref:Fimbrial protein n=1 Tax=Babesia caballi TaxID=5871 RepID=A0AAV4LMW0_BABCB|nr:fimbrial protein [Babesia caballi]
MTQDPGTGCRVAGRIRRLDKAKAREAIGEEGLEGGVVGTFAAGGAIFTIVFAIDVVAAAIMLTIRFTIALVRSTDVRLDVFACSINVPPKSAIAPTASDSVSIAALYVQKTQLKLQGVGVVGKSTENTGA